MAAGRGRGAVSTLEALVFLSAVGVALAVAVTVVALVARVLVERHAEQYAAVVRSVAEAHQAAEHEAAVARIIAAGHREAA